MSTLEYSSLDMAMEGGWQTWLSEAKTQRAGETERLTVNHTGLERFNGNTIGRSPTGPKKHCSLDFVCKCARACVFAEWLQ